MGRKTDYDIEQRTENRGTSRLVMSSSSRHSQTDEDSLRDACSGGWFAVPRNYHKYFPKKK